MNNVTANLENDKNKYCSLQFYTKKDIKFAVESVKKNS